MQGRYGKAVGFGIESVHGREVVPHAPDRLDTLFIGGSDGELAFGLNRQLRCMIGTSPPNDEQVVGPPTHVPGLEMDLRNSAPRCQRHARPSEEQRQGIGVDALLKETATSTRGHGAGDGFGWLISFHVS